MKIITIKSWPSPTKVLEMYFVIFQIAKLLWLMENVALILLPMSLERNNCRPYAFPIFSIFWFLKQGYILGKTICLLQIFIPKNRQILSIIVNI